MKISNFFILLNILLIAVINAGCASFQRTATNWKILFQSERGENDDWYIMNPDGSDQKKFTSILKNAGSTINMSDPNLSPDGSRIAFVSNRDGNDEIYVLDLNNGAQYNLTKNKANDYSPAWSPDGKYIAFLSDRDSVMITASQGYSTNNIYIMDSNGVNVRRLTKDNVTSGYAGLSWSPDGNKLAFYMSAATPYGGYFSRGINLLDLRDLRLSNLTTYDGTYDQGSLKWSPDGKHIAYVVYGSKFYNIYLMNADGTNQIALSKDPSNLALEPSWSPDGKYIVFLSRRDGQYHVYIMNADVTNQKRLTSGSGEDNSPIWIPAPRYPLL